jgi:hypothetical protein
MMKTRFLVCCVLAASVAGGSARAAFNLTVTITNPASFTATQLTNLQGALATAEAGWEQVITGYQPGIAISGVSIAIISGSAFADTFQPATVFQGGFTLATSTTIRINPAVIDSYASWDGAGPPNPNPAYLGQNYLDNILMHEMGHALGIGTLWDENSVYTFGTGQYTGTHGVQAYQAEFDPSATFVPVELAGSSGTMNTHWDQLMRSSSQEGNPSDPWSLSPLTGVTDAHGRDRAMELMTGALDPDYGQPFLSNTTIQSLRDLGFTVVPEPGAITLLVSLCLVVVARRQ